MNSECRLARLARYPTAYELAINTIDGRKLLIAYSQRRTTQCLLANMRAHRETLCRLIDDCQGDLNRTGPAYVAPTWRIGFTGRTERQAISEGELPRMSEAAQ